MSPMPSPTSARGLQTWHPSHRPSCNLEVETSSHPPLRRARAITASFTPSRVMPSVEIELSDVKLSSKRPCLSLSLSTRVSLVIPADLDQDSSADDIARLVEAGKLWVSRAGTCLLRVSAATVSRPIPLSAAASAKAESILDALSSCPVWSSSYYVSRGSDQPRHGAS